MRLILSKEVSLKRARAEPNLSNEPSRDMSVGSISIVQRSRPKRPDTSLQHISHAPGRVIRTSYSEPTSRVISPVTYTQHPSEPLLSRQRMRFDGVEVPTYRQIIERERHETPL